MTHDFISPLRYTNQGFISLDEGYCNPLLCTFKIFDINDVTANLGRFHQLWEVANRVHYM